jgi:hypothetical protein
MPATPGLALGAIRYHDLGPASSSQVDRVIAFLSRALPPEQEQAAIALVGPKRERSWPGGERIVEFGVPNPTSLEVSVCILGALENRCVPSS